MKKRVKSKISCCNFFAKNRRGQIWVETVIYTLIAFAMIGLVLAFAKPEIERIQDKAIIEQSIQVMEDIDIIITELVQGGSGNKRLIELKIKEGVLKIDSGNDKILFELEGKHTYSEPGVEITEGNLKIYTKQQGKLNFVNITRDYSGTYNITYDGTDILKSISKASTPYNILISNNGKDASEKIIIDIEIS